MFTIRASNEIDEYRQCLQFQFHYYATLLTYAKIKYTKMYLIITVMYVKKITSFCQVLKKMHAKENWFFSASRCVLQTVIVNKLADWWAAAVVGCWRPIYDASISI